MTDEIPNTWHEIPGTRPPLIWHFTQICFLAERQEAAQRYPVDRMPLAPPPPINRDAMRPERGLASIVLRAMLRGTWLIRKIPRRNWRYWHCELLSGNHLESSALH